MKRRETFMRNRKYRSNSARNCNSVNSSNGNVAGAFENGNGNNVETVFSPTENVQNVRTNNRTVRRVHPTHIQNVNRNITRVENFFPVTESVEDVNIVKEFNCGSDLDNPCCKPVNNCNKSW